VSERAFLFLVADAIPFDLAEEAWAAGALPGFRPPRPMISVVPSLTNVAVGALLGGVFDEVPMGYEARYLDPSTRELRGGFHDPRSEAAMAHLHGRAKGFLEHMAVYLLRGALAYGQVHWITHAFVRAGKPWLAYVPATDGVAHFGGRTGLRRSFLAICKAVREAREEHRRRTGALPGVVMCSDHGMAFGRFAHLSTSELQRRLDEAGFPSGPPVGGGAALVAYGDVGGGIVYVDPSRAAAAAEVVAGAAGVDVAFGRDGDGCVAIAMRDGRPSRARISWRGDHYRYDTLDGDPLGYGDVWDALGRERKLEDGWARDADLRRAAATHAYPDALARVRHGLLDIVRSPAPVLFSMKATWTYGPALTHAAAELMGGQFGTHGSLAAAESVGFAICDDADEPAQWRDFPALRPHEVLRPWRALVRAGRADA
jgi:hypothetical protein